MLIAPACVFLAIVLNDHNVSDSYYACFQSFLWALSIYLEVYCKTLSWRGLQWMVP